jgi:hypothetical protein
MFISTDDMFGYIPGDPRGYVGPRSNYPVAYWSRLRVRWQHAFTLDVVDFRDPDIVHLPAHRTFWG